MMTSRVSSSKALFTAMIALSFLLVQIGAAEPTGLLGVPNADVDMKKKEAAPQEKKGAQALEKKEAAKAPEQKLDAGLKVTNLNGTLKFSVEGKEFTAKEGDIIPVGAQITVEKGTVELVGAQVSVEVSAGANFTYTAVAVAGNVETSFTASAESSPIKVKAGDSIAAVTADSAVKIVAPKEGGKSDMVAEKGSIAVIDQAGKTTELAEGAKVEVVVAKAVFTAPTAAAPEAKKEEAKKEEKAKPTEAKKEEAKVTEAKEEAAPAPAEEAAPAPTVTVVVEAPPPPPQTITQDSIVADVISASSP